MINFLLLGLGVAFLAVGGEALIRGSLAVARRLNVSPLLSGLIIVGFGTSAPELVVSLDAVLSERPDIAIGNVVGSNIGNILLILGVCALIRPLSVKPLALRRDAIVVVTAGSLFLILTGENALGRPDAAIFLLAFVVYLIWAYLSERLITVPSAILHKAEADEISAVPKTILRTLMALIIGLIMLIGGSQILIKGAIGIAESLQISETVIGLTLVAIGTSIPELSVSAIAMLRKHADVAVGNILGSNIFNLLGILGVSALLQPLPVQERIVQFDQWVMLGTSILLLFFLYTGRSLSRWEGGILLAGYGIYLSLTFSVFN